MMKSEFEARTLITVSSDEYEEIEQAYYGFQGGKDDFCAMVKANLDKPRMLDLFFVTCYRSDGNLSYEDNRYRVTATTSDEEDTIEERYYYRFKFTARLSCEEHERKYGIIFYTC